MGKPHNRMTSDNQPDNFFYHYLLPIIEQNQDNKHENYWHGKKVLRFIFMMPFDFLYFVLWPPLCTCIYDGFGLGIILSCFHNTARSRSYPTVLPLPDSPS